MNFIFTRGRSSSLSSEDDRSHQHKKERKVSQDSLLHCFFCAL